MFWNFPLFPNTYPNSLTQIRVYSSQSFLHIAYSEMVNPTTNNRIEPGNTICNRTAFRTNSFTMQFLLELVNRFDIGFGLHTLVLAMFTSTLR